MEKQAIALPCHSTVRQQNSPQNQRGRSPQKTHIQRHAKNVFQGRPNPPPSAHRPSFGATPPWGSHGVGLSDEAGAAGWAGSVVRGPDVSGPRTHRAVLSFCFLFFGARANPSEIKVPLRRRGRGAPAQGRGVEHRGGAGAAMLKLGEHVPHDWLGHRARACATV